jgi:DNA-directed RNA polymerase specialized sigma24 family protein
VLVGVYGYPHEEAAQMLGMAVGTSKAHFHQARRRLIARLESQT